MPGMHNILEHSYIECALVNSDIGGTNDTSKYVDLTNYGTVTFIVQLGDTFEATAANWNAADALDTFKLVQATDAAGTSSKDITGATNAQTAVGAAGNIYAITCNAEALDIANDFVFVAAYVAETGNTGTDNVQILAVRYNPRYSEDDMAVSAATVVV